MKRKERKCGCNPLKATLLCGILFLLVGVLGLSFTSYAWLSDSVQGSVSKVEGASYAIEITITRKDGDVDVPVGGTVSSDGVCSYELTANTEYKVTLTASGTASTGFAIFTVNGVNYYSAQIAPSETETVSFVVKSTGGTTLTFDYQWGSHGASSDRIGDRLELA